MAFEVASGVAAGMAGRRAGGPAVMAPANLVNLEGAVKAYGPRLLLDHVSAGVAAGDRIGVVGRNGAGKSTLLAVLGGREALDAGRATRTRDLRIGMLPQRSELAGSVASLVVGDRPQHEWAASPRTRSVLAALLSGVDLASPAERLSGGESRRVALAAVLIGEHDLLLLDEPTNHLDVEAIDWLAQHLAQRGEALVVVTHDRWFLDAVCNRTWELAGGRLHGYDGGYAAYVLARAERQRITEATDRRRRNLLRKELAWLRRGPPARTSKPRFRVEAANALIGTEPPPRDGVELARLATARLGKTVIDASDVTVTAGQRVLLDDVTWQLGPGDRVGLIGPNGSGKSTLLDLLAGPDDPAADPPGAPDAPPDLADAPADLADAPADLVDAPDDLDDLAPTPSDLAADPSDLAGAPDDLVDRPNVDGNRRGSSGLRPHSGQTDGGGEAGAGGGLRVTGRITRGKTVRLGYLRQTDTDLDPSLTPREAVTEVHGTLESAQGAAAASQLLDRLGLRGDTQWTPAGDLSGGERRRLQLLRLLAGEPNVLFLDEPTNDLDVDTLTELEDLLDGWPGSLVLVSHDRYFLERVTDYVLALLGDGRLSYLPGGIDEYLRLRLEPDGAGRSRAARDRVSRPASGGSGPPGSGPPGSGPPGSGSPSPGSPGPGSVGNGPGGGAALSTGSGKAAPPGSAAVQRAARKEMQRLERQIDRLTSREAELTAELAEHTSDYVRLTELGAELRGVQDQKTRLEDQWLQAAEHSTS
jgi:ATPase subunit of ABC transporter with duplicated ATPase domains